MVGRCRAWFRLAPLVARFLVGAPIVCGCRGVSHVPPPKNPLFFPRSHRLRVGPVKGPFFAALAASLSRFRASVRGFPWPGVRKRLRGAKTARYRAPLIPSSPLVLVSPFPVSVSFALAIAARLQKALISSPA